MTPAENAFIQATGQKAVEMIVDDMEKAGFVDLQLVLNVLCSVTAHFIGGVPDGSARDTCYVEFGRALKEHIERVKEGHAAHVTMGPTN